MKEIQTKWVVFQARGHENVKATHKTTLEITTEDWLTPRGDCIVGVSSEIGASGLPEWFKQAAKNPQSLIIFILCADNICDSIVGQGDPQLTLKDPHRIILRKSTYTDDKTVMTRANKAARDLRRDLVEKLKRGTTLTIYATTIRTV